MASGNRFYYWITENRRLVSSKSESVDALKIISRHKMNILVFGATGWIGSQLVKLLNDAGYTCIISKARLDDYLTLVNELTNTNATHVLLAAGLTGTPNIDWLESHKQEGLRVNVIGTSIVSDHCARRGIHMTYLATGCIYEYDQDHPIGGPGFIETDKPNFAGSFYSYTKIMTENIMREFPTSLILRIRMPLSDDDNPRNFITKIRRYQKVVNMPNSMTCLTDLLPLIPDMMTKQLTGVYNFTNPGVISHNQILDLYKEYIDPSFTYTNFSLAEQTKILKAGRSNNCLDCSKLLAVYPNIPPISVAIVDLFKRMQKNIHRPE